MTQSASGLGPTTMQCNDWDFNFLCWTLMSAMPKRGIGFLGSGFLLKIYLDGAVGSFGSLWKIGRKVLQISTACLIANHQKFDASN